MYSNSTIVRRGVYGAFSFDFYNMQVLVKNFMLGKILLVGLSVSNKATYFNDVCNEF